MCCVWQKAAQLNQIWCFIKQAHALISCVCQCDYALRCGAPSWGWGITACRTLNSNAPCPWAFFSWPRPTALRRFMFSSAVFWCWVMPSCAKDGLPPWAKVCRLHPKLAEQLCWNSRFLNRSASGKHQPLPFCQRIVSLSYTVTKVTWQQ